MPAAKLEAVNEEWLPKAKAAKLLGASLRQLERRAAQGYIEKKIGERDPRERNAPVFYSRADIVALKSGTPNRHAVPVPESEPAEQGSPKARKHESQPSTALAVIPARPEESGDPLVGLAARLARLAAAFPPAADPKPWISLEDAAEWSGLPAAWLLKEARAGHPFAINVGMGKREFWRFNREALGKTGGG